LTFPAGWGHQETHATVAAGEPNQAAVVQLAAAQNAGNLTPEAYLAQLATNKSITGSNGARETIGGYSAWVGHITVADQNQAPTTLDAAFIRKDAVLFQILGQSKQPGDVNEQRIFTTMRSFRKLTDPARINVTPDRVRVSTVNATGSFGTVVTALGARPADLETDAIMNNVRTTDSVVAGKLLKVVTRLH
jgi:predicted Zn-dependent protease